MISVLKSVLDALWLLLGIAAVAFLLLSLLTINKAVYDELRKRLKHE